MKNKPSDSYLEFEIDRIRRWWHERLSAGCQLSCLENYQAGYDYRGNFNWADEVSCEALYQEYFVTSLSKVSKRKFLALLENIVKLKKGSRYVELKDGKGRMFLRHSRVFFKFESLENYRARLN